jgi:hypothetical protein
MWQDQPTGSTKGFQTGQNILLGPQDKVAHVVGSSNDKKNWKQFWEDSTDARRKWPTKCRIMDCGKNATVGAHVYVSAFTGNVWYYILPTCQSCNMDRDTDYGGKGAYCEVKEDSVVVATRAKDCCFDK